MSSVGSPLVELIRGRPPSERGRDKTEQRKKFTRSNTLRCSKCKQFRHNSRSHRERNVLDMRRGKDKPRKQKIGVKRRVGRLIKDEGSTSKKAMTVPDSSSQLTPAAATTSSSQAICSPRQTRSVTAAVTQTKC